MHPDSATTMNLTACNHFRLFNGKEAENQLNELQKVASPSFEYAQDLIKHNLVVFRNGEQALQVCRRSRSLPTLSVLLVNPKKKNIFPHFLLVPSLAFCVVSLSSPVFFFGVVAAPSSVFC
jgi:hypothetical protein